MRIVQLLSQTHLTGAEAHAVTLAESLIHQGHHVVLVSDRIHLSTRATYIPRPIDAARGYFARRREIRWLKEYLRTEKIDVVHAHSRAAVRIAWGATRGTTTALVSTVHGRQHFSWGKRLFDHYGERVIAVCENIRQHLIAGFRMRASRIHVITNPIDFPTEALRAEAAPDLPASSEHGHRWLLVTRWSGPKGQRAIELLQDVLTPLMVAHPGLRVDWAGVAPEAGSSAESLLQQMHSQFPDRFHGLGFVDPLEDHFPKYDLILGAGRVALAAAGRGQACFAFGEAETCGLIRAEKLAELFASNFGDISLATADQHLNRELTHAHLNQMLRREGPPPSELVQISRAVRERSETARVVGEIIDVYSSARLLKHHPRPIPVLMYHQVVSEPIDTPHRIFVTADTFAEHLKTFRQHGRQTLVFQDLLDFKEGRRPLTEFPKKPLLLTFDDGYENNLRLALPLLKSHGFKAVIYLLADSGLQKNTWDEGASPQVPLMTPAQRKELAQSGVFEIGSHGFQHGRLPRMTDEQASKELVESKRTLEKELGVPIHSFAFTYGDIDENSADQARRAGYRYALNTDQGAIKIEENPHAVFRVNVFPEDGARKILKKASWWYRWRYHWTRGK